MKGDNMQIKKIKLNFLTSYVMFYDWLKSDDIKEYSNVSIYRVNNEAINDFMEYNIVLRDEISIINKPAIFTDTYNSLAIIFDKNGNSVYKSSLLLEDEININEDAINLKLSSFNYDKVSKNGKDDEIRLIAHIKSTILNELEIIDKEENSSKLEYFYYELFNKKGVNYNKMINQIKEELNGNLSEKEIYLYEIIQKSYKLV